MIDRRCKKKHTLDCTATMHFTSTITRVELTFQTTVILSLGNISFDCDNCSL